MGSDAIPPVHGTVRVREVVREVVAEVAPEELAVVAGLARLDDATVVRRLERGGGRREPLGFGLGEIATMAAPVVWLVLDQTARQLGDAAANGAVTGARSLLRRVFRRRGPEVTVPALTPGQLAEVHRRVREMAAQRGFDEEPAEAIADAVVARLALTASEEQTSRDGPLDPSPEGGEPPQE
ncbi:MULTISPECIES: hypothetical protein [Streptomyces]|uniref:hypothetical protein n=1 Tax=Streptomyces TaxID=1883 RepID=UPI001963DBFC|nr:MULTISPECIES: hypothetical protein [Streptomyces]QRX90362.1 hypothetical protein JNO44_05430 [Streptomyces noursei]UJB40272.1 hypothetical protein HRD51_04845 [Streptomyces sp. A1-5]